MPIYPLIRVEESMLRSLTSSIIATYSLKGTVSRDFLLQVFFVNHLLPGLDYSSRFISNFFNKRMNAINSGNTRSRKDVNNSRTPASAEELIAA